MNIFHKKPKFELDASIYSARFGADVFFRRTVNDYRIRSVDFGSNIDTHALEGIDFDGLEVSITGVNLYYIFNYRHFSYPAAFAQSSCQKISCGSWMAGLGYLNNHIDFDYNRLEALAKQHLEIEALCSEKHEITDRQVFVNSIRDTALKGNNGLFRINLKWNTEDDLDLHLILPNGTIDTNEDIYYGHLRAEYKKGVCSLDHDAIPTNPGENPQENITWENCLPDGQYRVVVKLYNKKSKNEIIPFSVTAFTGKYAKTEVYEFCNAESKDTIEIATIVFKEGKVVTPITFK